MFSSKDLFFTPTSGAYTISKSLRFRSSASAYLNRTPASTSNQTTWTWSGWVKRGTLGGSGGNTPYFFSSSSSTTNATFLALGFNGDYLVTTGYTTEYTRTNAIFRDPSAWYHIVIAFDTTQATASNRIKCYVNGVLQTLSNTTYVAQNFATPVNLNQAHYFGGYNVGAGAVVYFDGYMAEVNFIDGQALTPSSFGAYDTNGIWQPAAYTGTYGTNGFYLKFTTVGATSGSNTGYGQDFSGNGNYWTTNNFGTTSTATTYDSMLDSPTNAAGDIGNYAVLNPIFTSGSPTLSSANLNATGGATQSSVSGTIGANSGKYYAEFVATAIGSNTHFGVFALGNNPNGANVGPGQDSRCIYRNDGGVFTSTQVATYASYTTSNTIGVALNLDASPPTVAFYKDNVLQGTINLSTSFSNWTFAMLFNASSDAAIINFGQRPFTYTPPSGFSALNTQNLTTPTITNGAQYFAAVTYTGTGSNPRTISTSSTNSGNNPLGTTFQPDLVWGKARNTTYRNRLQNSVVGANKLLISDLTDTEYTNETNGYLTAFTADGFTVTAGSTSDDGVNNTNDTYIAWEWKASGSSGTISPAGTIAAVGSANQTAGFSIITYTGTGTTGTVGHGLGAAPNMIILKARNQADSWLVYHSGLPTPATNTIILNSTGAVQTSSPNWNSQNPNSTIFNVYNPGSGGYSNGNGYTYVAYCFAAISSYSAFGSYTANANADGPMVFLNFRPRYVLLKNTTRVSDWIVYDSSRDLYNTETQQLYPNLGSAEASGANIDFLSNGFKIRAGSGSGINNTSGDVYIYAAFAENPFKISRAR